MTPLPALAADDRWLAPADVANLLGVARSTVHRYTTARRLPPPDHRLGSTPLWRESTIRAWRSARPGAGARTDLTRAKP